MIHVIYVVHSPPHAWQTEFGFVSRVREREEKAQRKSKRSFALTTDTDNHPSFTSRWVLLVILVTRGQLPELDPRITRRRELTKRDDNPPTLVLDPREFTLYEFEVVTSSSVLFDWRGE